MIKITILIGIMLLLYSCGGGDRQATASTSETIETIKIASTDPVIIDIAGNLENRKEFRLSDFGLSARYIRIQLPEGVEFTRTLNVLSDNDNIFINTVQGLFWYSAKGEYIAPLHINEFENTEHGARMLRGIASNVDLLNGSLFYYTIEGRESQPNILDVKELKNKILSDYHVQFQSAFFPRNVVVAGRNFLIDNQSYLTIGGFTRPVSTFTAMSIQGDTLFRLNNYYQPTIRGGSFSRTTETFYRIGGNVMLQKAYNDTVFALIPPNRLEPAFVMDWGEFRPDMNRFANGGAEEGKFILRNWVETQQHIFIEYTEGRDFPARREREGNIPRHLAIFDKETKTLTHHTAPIFMFENDIDPVGMPFFPQGVNHHGEMYMVFSKAQVQQQIDIGRFNNSRLQALYNRMPEGSFYLMIVK